jgi:hypothetical protein
MKSWVLTSVVVGLSLVPSLAASEDGPSASIPTESVSLTDRVYRDRLLVVAVDAQAERMRIRGADGFVYSLAFPRGTMVIGARRTGPGDLVRIERPADGPMRLHVLRSGSQEIGSPEN